MRSATVRFFFFVIYNPIQTYSGMEVHKVTSAQPHTVVSCINVAKLPPDIHWE
jgi:hypothetical protein